MPRPTRWLTSWLLVGPSLSRCPVLCRNVYKWLTNKWQSLPPVLPSKKNGNCNYLVPHTLNPCSDITMLYRCSVLRAELSCVCFWFTVGEFSEAGRWDWDECGGGENQGSEARTLCPAYLHCEWIAAGSLGTDVLISLSFLSSLPFTSLSLPSFHFPFPALPFFSLLPFLFSPFLLLHFLFALLCPCSSSSFSFLLSLISFSLFPSFHPLPSPSPFSFLSISFPPTPFPLLLVWNNRQPKGGYA